MKISMEDLRKGAGIVGQAGGAEAAIVAQFVVDLAVTARFNAAGEAIARGKPADSCGFGSRDTVR